MTARRPTKPRRRLEVYKASDGWRFRAVAGNGRIVGASEQAVKQRTYAIRRAVRQFPLLPLVVVNDDATWTLSP